MPVPDPNLYPDFNIVRLSHVDYRVTDLAKARAFYVDTLGLQVTEESNETIYLRAMEERGHHCIALHAAKTADVAALSFKVFDEEDLEKAAHWFAARDIPTEWVERPFQGRTLRARGYGFERRCGPHVSHDHSNLHAASSSGNASFSSAPITIISGLVTR